jgi:hypothetical protein
MTTQATATFTVTSWDEKDVHSWDQGGKITRASIGYAFEGDLEGQVSSENLMVYAPDGTAVIVGLDRFVGTVGGRTGSFVAETRGTYDGTTARGELTVVEGSATGELAGIRGGGTSEVTSEPPGTIRFAFDVP